jgi:HK97 family phage major capsid protein
MKIKLSPFLAALLLSAAAFGLLYVGPDTVAAASLAAGDPFLLGLGAFGMGTYSVTGEPIGEGIKLSQIPKLMQDIHDMENLHPNRSYTRDWRVLKGQLIESAQEITEKAEASSRNFTAQEEKQTSGLISAARRVEIEVMRSQEKDEKDRAELAAFFDSKFGGPAMSGCETWLDAAGKPVPVLRPADKLENHFRNDSGLTFGGFVRAMIGANSDAKYLKALAEGSDSSGGYTVPSALLPQVIDAMRAQTVCIRAGARTIPLTTNKSSFARMDTDPTTTWHSENAADFPASDPTFSRVSFYTKTLICLVKMSRELAEDSLNIDSAINRAFGAAMALELDRVALVGDGASEPMGVANDTESNILDLGTNGAALSGFDNLIDANYQVQLDNGQDPTAAIMHPRTFRDYAKMKDGQGLPLQRPQAIRDLPFLSTTKIPIDTDHGTAENTSRIFLGHYPSMVFGIRTALRIEVLKELYAENFQYGLLAYLRADVVTERGQNFCVIKGILPSS